MARGLDTPGFFCVRETFLLLGDALRGPTSQPKEMSNKDPLKSYCPECGEQFGNAWQRIALAQHMWKVHAIPGKATFNGKTAKFGDDQ